MHPYKHTFTLIQHTPMIHFQWDQQGALLRATELKPKFDKFILAHTSKVPLGWYVGGRNAKKKDEKDLNHQALDYKMRIMPSSQVETRVIQKDDNFPPMFFGNMGKEYIGKEKALQTTKGPIEVELTSMAPGLLPVLKELFPRFLAQTNFGTRQNKGFGSFYLRDAEKAGLDIATLFPDTPYLLIQTQKLEQILMVINYYYQRLKSGINFKGHYCKSALSQQLEGMTWEKPWVKDKFVGNLNLPKRDYRFARALLGLPGSFTYKPNNRGQRPPYPRFETEITIEDPRDASEAIARIKSPLTFKPIKEGRTTKIYIFAKPYTLEEKQLLADTAFAFTAKGQTHTLKLPAADQFPDLDQLLQAYHQELGREFEARDYTGKAKEKVQIHPWEGGTSPAASIDDDYIDPDTDPDILRRLGL